jgi:hypothetical protein
MTFVVVVRPEPCGQPKELSLSVETLQNRGHGAAAFI